MERWQVWKLKLTFSIIDGVDGGEGGEIRNEEEVIEEFDRTGFSSFAKSGGSGVVFANSDRGNGLVTIRCGSFGNFVRGTMMGMLTVCLFPRIRYQGESFVAASCGGLHVRNVERYEHA